MSAKIATGNKFGLLGQLHRFLISRGRAEKLTSHLASLFDYGSSVLDVGCGYGLVAQRLIELRPDISLT